MRLRHIIGGDGDVRPGRLAVAGHALLRRLALRRVDARPGRTHAPGEARHRIEHADLGGEGAGLVGEVRHALAERGVADLVGLALGLRVCGALQTFTGGAGNDACADVADLAGGRVAAGHVIAARRRVAAVDDALALHTLFAGAAAVVGAGFLVRGAIGSPGVVERAGGRLVVIIVVVIVVVGPAGRRLADRDARAGTAVAPAAVVAAAAHCAGHQADGRGERNRAAGVSCVESHG